MRWSISKWGIVRVMLLAVVSATWLGFFVNYPTVTSNLETRHQQHAREDGPTWTPQRPRSMTK